MSQHLAPGTSSVLNWDRIDDVLIDMDGTLLDRHFDNFFFEEDLPRRYVAMQGLSFDASRGTVNGDVPVGGRELAWTDLHYSSGRVGIDVVAMHLSQLTLIGFLLGAEDFLKAVRIKGKRRAATNAHEAGVAVKSAKTGLDRYVGSDRRRVRSGLSQDEMPEYWPGPAAGWLDSTRAALSMLTTTEMCSAAASHYGIATIIHSAKSSSQLPPVQSSKFASVEHLPALLNGRR